MHFQRIPRAYWRDRLRKARAMGLNTIETYVFWNAVEPQRGQFDFSGRNDVAAFVRMAQAEGSERDPAARPLCLRRVGGGRVSGLAVRRPAPARAHAGPGLPAQRSMPISSAWGSSWRR